jgi:hypothetical protein
MALRKAGICKVELGEFIMIGDWIQSVTAQKITDLFQQNAVPH